MLKFRYDSQTDIPEALRAFFTENATTKKWEMQIEGASSNERVAEFRDKNIALEKKVKDLETQWDGFDVNEVKALVLKKKEIEDSKVKSENEFMKRLDERIGEMKKEHTTELGKVTAERDSTKAALKKAVIEKSILEETGKLGLRPEAVTDVLARGLQTWTLNEKNEAVAMEGDKVIYGTDTLPLTMKAWSEGMVKQAPHLFLPSQGSGSNGGHQQQQNNNQNQGDNPWKPGAGYNMTKQGQIIKDDPTRAKALAKEAGIDLVL